MKKQLGDERSHVAAKPKGFKVGGMTAHHNKVKLTEARDWNNKPQDEINGMVFADESKMRFREHPNKQINMFTRVPYFCLVSVSQGQLLYVRP